MYHKNLINEKISNRLRKYICDNIKAIIMSRIYKDFPKIKFKKTAKQTNEKNGQIYIYGQSTKEEMQKANNMRIDDQLQR